MTLREHIEDAAAFTLALIVMAAGVVTSWPVLAAGLFIAVLVVRDWRRQLKASRLVVGRLPRLREESSRLDALPPRRAGTTRHTT